MRRHARPLRGDSDLTVHSPEFSKLCKGFSRCRRGRARLRTGLLCLRGGAASQGEVESVLAGPHCSLIVTVSCGCKSGCPFLGVILPLKSPALPHPGIACSPNPFEAGGPLLPCSVPSGPPAHGTLGPNAAGVRVRGRAPSFIKDHTKHEKLFNLANARLLPSRPYTLQGPRRGEG